MATQLRGTAERIRRMVKRRVAGRVRRNEKRRLKNLSCLPRERKETGYAWPQHAGRDRSRARRITRAKEAQPMHEGPDLVVSQKQLDAAAIVLCCIVAASIILGCALTANVASKGWRPEQTRKLEVGK